MVKQIKHLNIQVIDTREILDFKKIESGETHLIAETEKAIRLCASATGQTLWLPKSVCRLGSDGALWVQKWFYEKEMEHA